MSKIKVGKMVAGTRKLLNGVDDPMKAMFALGYQESHIKMSKTRSIFFSEDVMKRSGAELSAMLLYYDHQDHGEPIYLYLHSNGGDLAGLSNIYDVMQMIEAPVKTILMGKCYSAGAVILAAGAKGERFAMPSAKVMIHGVQFGFPIPQDDMKNNASYLKFIEGENDKVIRMLSKHTGQPLEKVREDCKREMFFDAESALEYGLVDQIL
jgi:ATP-dependent Clp protease protease subunit